MKENIIALTLTILLGLSLVGCQANVGDIKEIITTSVPSLITNINPLSINPLNINPTDNITKNDQDLNSSINDNSKIVTPRTPSFISVKPTPKPLTNNHTNTPFVQSNTEIINNKDVSTPKPLIVEPKEWIDPAFEIIRGELGGYFRIIIKNKAEYIGKNYEMKAECISHPFNESLKYQTDGKEIIFDNTFWKTIDSNYYLAYLCKADYALPDNVKKYPITIGMKISYVISIQKNDFVNEYPITVTVE